MSCAPSLCTLKMLLASHIKSTGIPPPEIPEDESPEPFSSYIRLLSETKFNSFSIVSLFVKGLSARHFSAPGAVFAYFETISRILSNSRECRYFSFGVSS